MGEAAASGRSYRLRRGLAAFAAALVALVVVTGAGTVLIAIELRQAIVTARTMEASSRRAALLSVIVREQYIHEAHTIIVRDRSHMAHHDEWVRKLAAELATLRSDVDEQGAERLDAIAAASARLLEVFNKAILPAVDRSDWPAVHESHHRANALVDEMTGHADALADYFADRATSAQTRSEVLVRFAFAGSIVVGLVAATVAFALARRLWRSFARPLGALEEVARTVAEGERGARVASLAAAELEVVGRALNRMLDSLAAAEAELVDKERLAALGRVAAGVAHEINNPIAIIRGYVSEMKQDTQAVGLGRELEVIDEEARACERIASDLLLYARRPPIAKEAVPVGDLLGEAAKHGVPAAGLATALEVEAAIIEVDPLRIRQVVVNLIRNAHDAGGAEPVLVRGSRRDEDYRIEVLDRGRGLSAEAHAHLFEPFFTTRRDGSGLGLAVSYGLVAAHGGSIRAEPREGGGTRFVVELPGVVVERRVEVGCSQ